jgi:hypothetical protein
MTVVLAGVIISTGQYCLFWRAIPDGSLWIGSAIVAVSSLLAVAIYTNNINPGTGLLIGLFSSLVQWYQFKGSLRDSYWWMLINTFGWILVFWSASHFAP